MQNRVPLKYQKLIVGYILCLLLAAYSTSGFWNHIDGLQSGYGWMMKIGVLAGEFACFVLVTWHVLRQWVWTRVYCLVASLLLGGTILYHNAGVIQIDAAKVENQSTINTVAEGQAKIAEKTAQGIGKGVADLKQSGATKGQVSRAVQSGQKEAAKAGAEAGKILAETALKANEQAESKSMLSASYRHGPMYALIFVVALVAIGGAFGVMEWGAPYEDDDHDGIPNYAEAGHRYYDREMAAKYWHLRGYLAPHENPSQGRVSNGLPEAPAIFYQEQPQQTTAFRENPMAQRALPVNGEAQWSEDSGKDTRH